MTEKRYRSEQIIGASLPFIVDNHSAKKHETMTGYKAYDTNTMKKCEELTDLLNNYEKENEQLKQHLKHSEKRTAIISGWLHDEGNMTLDKYEEILDYCYQEYKNEGLIDSNDKNKIFSDFKNFKLQKDMMEINDMLNEYYTADPSLNIIPKLNSLLTELKYHRQASNTVEWQAYKEKEFEGL